MFNLDMVAHLRRFRRIWLAQCIETERVTEGVYFLSKQRSLNVKNNAANAVLCSNLVRLAL